MKSHQTDETRLVKHESFHNYNIHPQQAANAEVDNTAYADDSTMTENQSNNPLAGYAPNETGEEAVDYTTSNGYYEPTTYNSTAAASNYQHGYNLDAESDNTYSAEQNSYTTASGVNAWDMPAYDVTEAVVRRSSKPPAP